MLLAAGIGFAGTRPAAAPATVEALWAGYDPCREPLEARTVREWREEGVVLRYVLYTVGTFKGRKARMAAFYGFGEGGGKRASLLHLHGGGQRAFVNDVRQYARRGYACLSINWGGRPMENARPGEPNTDWGAVDPTQKNVPGYFNFRPGPKTLDPYPSPRNNNWYLLTIAARRGLTFLERQAEVDPQRLGVYGHSMGGNLTVYVAGTDDRVKAAAPSVGGSGFRSYTRRLLPGWRPRRFGGFEALYRRTLAFQAYAPRIRAPLLYLGATNDFHGLMDDTYRTGALIPHARVRYSFAPHLNHRFTPAFAVTRPLWLDQHLRGGPALARTPKTRLALQTPDRVPRLVVTPDRSQRIERVAVYYAVDADPRARFWRPADAKPRGETWSAALPIMSAEQPLYTFANVHYALEEATTLGRIRSDRYAISSLLHTVEPAQLAAAKVRATDKPSATIDDFSAPPSPARGWYVLNAGNRQHWQYWTRKVTDPKWRGPAGAELVLQVRSQRANTLVVVLIESEWRHYRGPKRTFAAVVPLKGGDETQTVRLAAGDFKDAAGAEALSSWKEIDQLALVPYWNADRARGGKWLGGKWQGAQPQFRSLRWSVGKEGEPGE